MGGRQGEGVKLKNIYIRAYCKCYKNEYKKVIGHEVVIAVYYKPHWALLVSFTPPVEL